MAAAGASNGIASIDPFDIICHSETHTIKHRESFQVSFFLIILLLYSAAMFYFCFFSQVTRLKVGKDFFEKLEICIRNSLAFL